MSRSGFPGRRVAAIREGISTRVRVSVMEARGSERQITEEMTGVFKGSRVYTGCQKAGKPLSRSRCPYCAARRLQVANSWPFHAAAYRHSGLGPDPKWTPS